MVDKVLAELNEEKEKRKLCIRKKMDELEFSNELIEDVMNNYDNLKKDIYEELNFV